MNRFLAFGLLLCLPFPSLAKSKAVPPPPPVVLPAPPPDPLAVRPVPGPAVPLVPPTPAASELANHVPLWVLTASTLPIFTVVLTVPGGSQLDGAGKEGVAALAMEAMRHGAGSRSGAAFAAEVERRGLGIEGSTGPDGSQVILIGPSDQLAAGLDLLADLVMSPRLESEEIQKSRDLLLAGLEQSFAEPSYVAERVANALYWGPNHPYGRPADGTASGLAKATDRDVRRWHKAVWHAGGATITVAGDVTTASLVPLLNARFGRWRAEKLKPVSVPEAPVHEAEPLYLVDVPDSAQTGFYVAFPGLRHGAEAAVPTQVGTIVLGGTFTSRLNALLREKRGYTYGVRAAMNSARSGGTLVVRTRIRTDVTAPALVDLRGELEGIRKGITAEELAKAQGAARQDVVEALESQAGTAALFASYLTLGRPAASVATELTTLAAATVDSVFPAMAAWNADRAVFVLVGDRTLVEPALGAAGFTKLKVVTPLK